MNTEDKWYNQGLRDGKAAAYSRGGTRGATWYADQLGLTDTAREDYIDGFNDGLDEFEDEE